MASKINSSRTFHSRSGQATWVICDQQPYVLNEGAVSRVRATAVGGGPQTTVQGGETRFLGYPLPLYAEVALPCVRQWPFGVNTSTPLPKCCVASPHLSLATHTPMQCALIRTVVSWFVSRNGRLAVTSSPGSFVYSVPNRAITGSVYWLLGAIQQDQRRLQP